VIEQAGDFARIFAFPPGDSRRAALEIPASTFGFVRAADGTSKILPVYEYARLSCHGETSERKPRS
jgi:hypothetical protein